MVAVVLVVASPPVPALVATELVGPLVAPPPAPVDAPVVDGAVPEVALRVPVPPGLVCSLLQAKYPSPRRPRTPRESGTGRNVGFWRIPIEAAAKRIGPMDQDSSELPTVRPASTELINGGATERRAQ